MAPAPGPIGPGAGLTRRNHETRLPSKLMGAATEEELLERAQQGYLAFGELVYRLVPAVVAPYFGRFRLRHWEREDLFQNTYERTLKAHSLHVGRRPKQTVDSLRAWMSTVAYRLSINLWRANRRLVLVPEQLDQISSDPTPAEEELTAESLDHVRREHGDEAVELWTKNKIFNLSVEGLAQQHGTTIHKVRYKVELVQVTLRKWVSRG
jgi:DNA-directed RNA polymerase specialized sigma24 family protein